MLLQRHLKLLAPLPNFMRVCGVLHKEALSREWQASLGMHSQVQPAHTLLACKVRCGNPLGVRGGSWGGMGGKGGEEGGERKEGGKAPLMLHFSCSAASPTAKALPAALLMRLRPSDQVRSGVHRPPPDAQHSARACRAPWHPNTCDVRSLDLAPYQHCFQSDVSSMWGLPATGIPVTADNGPCCQLTCSSSSS